MFVNTCCKSLVKHKDGSIGESGAPSTPRIPVPLVAHPCCPHSPWAPGTQPRLRGSRPGLGSQGTRSHMAQMRERHPGQNLFLLRESGDSSRNLPTNQWGWSPWGTWERRMQERKNKVKAKMKSRGRRQQKVQLLKYFFGRRQLWYFPIFSSNFCHPLILNLTFENSDKLSPFLFHFFSHI